MQSDETAVKFTKVQRPKKNAAISLLEAFWIEGPQACTFIRQPSTKVQRPKKNAAISLSEAFWIEGPQACTFIRQPSTKVQRPKKNAAISLLEAFWIEGPQACTFIRDCANKRETRQRVSRVKIPHTTSISDKERDVSCHSSLMAWPFEWPWIHTHALRISLTMTVMQSKSGNIVEKSASTRMHISRCHWLMLVLHACGCFQVCMAVFYYMTWEMMMKNDKKGLIATSNACPALCFHFYHILIHYPNCNWSPRFVTGLAQDVCMLYPNSKPLVWYQDVWSTFHGTSPTFETLHTVHATHISKFGEEWIEDSKPMWNVEVPWRRRS